MANLQLTSPSPVTLILSTIALTGSGISAGCNLLSSLAVIPSYLHPSNSILPQQWKLLYDNGLKLVAPCSVASTTAFLALAWDAHTKGLKDSRMVFGVAAGLAFAFVPYTKLMMGEGIAKLSEVAEKREKGVGKEDVGKDAEVRKMVENWSRLNLIRALLPLTAVVFGTLGVAGVGAGLV